jgi:hypothetical protein
MTSNFSLESAAEKLQPTLRAFQIHWKEILSEHEPIVEHARAQLTYIDGLLDGLSGPAHANVGDVPVSAKLPKSSKKSAIAAPDRTNEESPKAPKKAGKKTTKGNSRASGPQFIAQYTGKTLTVAVGEILGDRTGEEMSIEDVVSVLYGELDTEAFKVGKDRVTKNLSKGKVMGLWDRVPEKSGYYTHSAESLKA